MTDRPCTRARKIIPSYVEAEASPMEALECASHLSSCAACADEERKARQVVETLRRLAEPEPPRREIADRVLSSLRAARRALGPGAALKWVSLGGLLVLAALPALVPEATLRLGLRAFARIGEILDPQAALERVVNLLPGLLPSLSSVADALRGAVPSAGGGMPRAGSTVALALAFLAAAFVLALVSGGLVFRAVHSYRSERVLPSNPASRSFDNPGRLP